MHTGEALALFHSHADSFVITNDFWSGQFLWAMAMNHSQVSCRHSWGSSSRSLLAFVYALGMSVTIPCAAVTCDYHVKVSPRTHEQLRDKKTLCCALTSWSTVSHMAGGALPTASGVPGVVVFCCEPGPVIANVLELSRKEKICSLLFAIRYVQQARSFSVLPRSPVRSSAVPRSETEEKRRAVSVRQSNSKVHRFLVAATDAIHSLSSQISVSEFYPTVQGSGRSPSSLCTSLVSQTILEFGNHCLWFRTSAVRKKCDDFLTSEKVAHETRRRCLINAIPEGDYMYFPDVLLA